jgi:hypothetical protein
MPHIPIPPSPTMTPQQIIQKLQQVNVISTQGQTTNIVQPNSNIAQQIRDIATEQARITMIELMKQQTELKKTVLTIENIDKIRGAKYSEWLSVGGVKEWDTHYEFTLLDNDSNQVETILLHRRQTSDKKYIMEYNNQTLWVTKDRLNTIDAIIECMKEI